MANRMQMQTLFASVVEQARIFFRKRSELGGDPVPDLLCGGAVVHFGFLNGTLNGCRARLLAPGQVAKYKRQPAPFLRR